MAVLGNKWRKSAGSAKVLPQIYHQLCVFIMPQIT